MAYSLYQAQLGHADGHGFIIGILCVFALKLTVDAIHTPITPVNPQMPAAVTITPDQRPPSMQPVTNTVPIDANGNPLPASAMTAPPGVDPAQYQQFLNWQTCSKTNTCTAQGGGTQTPALTPAQQAAEEYRKRMADLEWSARLAKPDAGNHSVQTTSAPPITSTPGPATSADEEKGIPQAPTATSTGSSTVPTQPATAQPAKNSIVPAAWNGDSNGASYTLLAGLSPIKARLLTAITGDVKGPVIAEVIQPVYSWDNITLLIPKGSFITGRYDRVSEQDQERLLLSIDTLVLPDAWRINFPPAEVLDQAGEAGVRDKVNHHYTQLFLTAVAVSAIGAGAQIGGGSTGGYSFSPMDALRIGFGEGASQTAQQIFSRFSNRKPTILIRNGTEIVVFPPIDIPLDEWGSHHVRKPV